MDIDDLDEFGEDDELTTNFTKAANSVQKLASSLDNDTLLTLYGFYKQGLEGPCNVPKPSWYDMKGKSKWEAWTRLGNMPQAEAKISYVNLVNKIDPNFDTSTSAGKEGWITVSTLQKPKEDSTKVKNIVDHIKDGNLEKVTECITQSGNELKHNINKLDENGLALIHWAADRGSLEILKILLNQGSRVNLSDSDGQTPLHYAVSCGHIACIEYLLEAGADAHIKDSDGLDCFAAASDDCVKGILSSFNT